MRRISRRLLLAVHVMRWVGLIAFAYVAALYIGAVLAQLFGLDSIIARLVLHSVLLVIMLLIVVASPFVLSRQRLLNRTDMGLSKMMSWKHLGIGVMGFLAYFAIMIIVSPLIRQIAWFNVDQPQELGFGGMAGVSLFLGFIVLAVVTPVIEEILFRGILQGKLRASGVPFVLTALIVAALFAAAHGQWNVAVDVFFMSIVASYVREKTGQLWPSIVIHVIKNTMAFYLAFVVVSGGM